MPLVLAKVGSDVEIINLKGKDGVKKQLNHLGLVPGTVLHIIQSNNGDMIVKVKESHLAINRESAMKIQVEELR